MEIKAGSGNRRQRHTAALRRTIAVRCGVSGADQDLSVPVDGDSHRVKQVAPLPVVAEVVMFFNVAAFGLALALATERPRAWPPPDGDAALVALTAGDLSARRR